MPKIIQYKFSDDQIEKLKKIYEQTKSKINNEVSSFEEFLPWIINIALDQHIQFTQVNNKMMDMLDDSFKKNDFDLNNIDEFINNIFDNSSSKPKTNKEGKNEKEDSDEGLFTDSKKVKN